jgi:hypothetical protein
LTETASLSTHVTVSPNFEMDSEGDGVGDGSGGGVYAGACDVAAAELLAGVDDAVAVVPHPASSRAANSSMRVGIFLDLFIVFS